MGTDMELRLAEGRPRFNPGLPNVGLANDAIPLGLTLAKGKKRKTCLRSELRQGRRPAFVNRLRQSSFARSASEDRKHYGGQDRRPGGKK
jgi:hypothetical protein